jgi:NADH-ubiquinone oxidoreductase chain 6
MFTSLVIIFTLSLGISMVTAYYPLSLGLWILILSISISVLIRTSFSRWFGFIIFLIYIGGILVIFAYFVAIQPNQQFNLKTPTFFLVLCIFNLPINIYPVTLNLMLYFNW